MMLPVVSEGEFSFSEPWGLDGCFRLVVGMGGMRLRVVVSMGRDALVVCPALIYEPGMFAGTRAVGGYAARPAGTIAGRGSVRVLQRLVFAIRI